MLSVKIDTKQFEQQIRQLDMQGLNRIWNAMEKTADDVIILARKYIQASGHVDSSNLLKGFQKKVSWVGRRDIQAEISNSVPYARWVDEGAKKHWVHISQVPKLVKWLRDNGFVEQTRRGPMSTLTGKPVRYLKVGLIDPPVRYMQKAQDDYEATFLDLMASAITGENFKYGDYRRMVGAGAIKNRKDMEQVTRTYTNKAGKQITKNVWVKKKSTEPAVKKKRGRPPGSGKGKKKT